MPPKPSKAAPERVAAPRPAPQLRERKSSPIPQPPTASKVKKVEPEEEKDAPLVCKSASTASTLRIKALHTISISG